jgi:hypothetical protein
MIVSRRSSFRRRGSAPGTTLDVLDAEQVYVDSQVLLAMPNATELYPHIN